MKVHFDNVNLGSNSGPNSFAQRLVEQLSKSGHQIYLGNGRQCDVSLVFIEPSGAPLATTVVQRLDGIWFKPSDYLEKNVSIKHLYHTADHVIWQSEFDKKMTTGLWGIPKSGSVIRNGVPGNLCAQKNPSVAIHLQELRNKHELIFVASANWHPQKRLSDNIKVFKHLRKFYPTACLIVMGSNAPVVQEENVYWTGSVPHSVCGQIYASSDWMIHTAWLDHCPNTVVEALSCGVPVICAEDGGTKELVGEYGIILAEKMPYNFSLVDYESPPPLNVEQISGRLPSRASLPHPPDVSIELSANRYMLALEHIIAGKNKKW